MRKNFISVDKKSALDSFGRRFEVGDYVSHEDGEVGEAVILSFEAVEEDNEVKVHTNKGWAHIDFIVKLKMVKIEEV